VFADRTLKAGSLEAKAAYQPIKTTYENGELAIYNRLDFTNLNEYEFSYWIEVDGKKDNLSVMAAEYKVNLFAEPHTWTKVSVDYEPVSCKYGVYLCGELKKDEKVYAKVQHKLPAMKAVPDDSTNNGNTVNNHMLFTEDKRNIFVTGNGFKYTFSKHDGAFTSLIIDDEEQLAGKMKLSAFRAPIDNEREIKKRWLKINEDGSENLDRAFTKVYSCRIEDETIIVEGSLAGVSRLPLLKYTLKVKVFADGQIDFKLHCDIRENAFWLQRLGFELELPETSDTFSYYGRGPIESYCDMCHWATVGMYESTAEKEYVNYVLPQEHGNHNEVSMLRIGKMEIVSEQGMEIQVSEYSMHELLEAKHTDELKKDGKTHLRIDYKNSGVGSAACGPELKEEYRLSEKVIDFAFAIKVER